MRAADLVVSPPPVTRADRKPLAALRAGGASAVLLVIFIGCVGGSSLPTGHTAVPSTPDAPTTAAPRTPTPQSQTSSLPSVGPTVEPESPAPTETALGDGQHNGPGHFNRPPPVTVSGGGKTLELKPWTFCYRGACVDGMSPRDPLDVGGTGSVAVEFPLDGWTFSASFRTVGRDCPRIQRVTVEQTGAHTHVLEPAGRAGTYDVTLFGRGNGGDLFVSFRWTTPHDGPMPVPAAVLGVLADHDGEVDSYGVEFGLSGLATSPTSVTAQVTVTAANGQSLTFKPVREMGCIGEGEVWWNGPESAGLQAADLGPAPFTYEVTVLLDGVRYAATAIWPNDQIEGNEPSVSLEFSPPLPALR